MERTSQPSPDLFFDTLTAYQKTEALKAALDLDLFTAIASAPSTANQIASRCQASPRGIRILADYLVVLGFLRKSGDNYELTQDSAVFLNRNSPGFAGGAAEFLLSDHLTGAFKHLAQSVKKGGTAQLSSVEPEHPMWLTFARSMGGLMVRAAESLAELLSLDSSRNSKVLDVAAGHGVWGIAFAKKYPLAHVVALDWGPVLNVALENANKAGVSERFSTIAGNAFDVPLGANYDVVLVPNFLHHFGTADCIRFLKKAHDALNPGGKVAIVEFVPNNDRVTPPPAATFSLVMLATTPEGDAYTFEEYATMLTEAGFNSPAKHPLAASVNEVIISSK